MTKKAQAIILGIVCLILTIGICVQIKTVNSNGTTTSANQELNNLKTQVLKMREKYEESYSRLERIQTELETTRSNITNNNEQLKILEEELRKYNVLLGTTEVNGPGVIITITDTDPKDPMRPINDNKKALVHDIDILEVVNELKNAGAEAIDVNGQRIVDTTAISCDGNVIVINGEKVSSTFVINAIGLPERLSTLKRPGGYLEFLEEDAIKCTLDKKDKVTVSKYINANKFKYAKTVK